MDNNSIKHHGIPGMKWGIRRFQNKDGTRTPAGKKRYDDSDDQNTTKPSRAKKKSVKDMSDDELRKKINRIQMEQQYSKLTARKKSAGEKFVTEVLTNSGKQIATKYTTEYGSKAVDKIIKSLSENITKSSKKSTYIDILT